MYPNVADAPPAPVRFGYPTVANNSFAIPPSPAPAAPALFAAREPNKACKLFLKSFLRRSIVSVDRQHLFNDWRRQDEDIFDVRAERVEFLDPNPTSNPVGSMTTRSWRAGRSGSNRGRTGRSWRRSVIRNWSWSLRAEGESPRPTGRPCASPSWRSVIAISPTTSA